jgi:hypothetical protein
MEGALWIKKEIPILMRRSYLDPDIIKMTFHETVGHLNTRSLLQMADFFLDVIIFWIIPYKFE